jgi:Bacterial Ig-like domain (group 2)
MPTQENYLIGLPGSIPTPPTGQVTRFLDSTFSPPKDSYKDEFGANYLWPGTTTPSDGESCCCEIGEKIMAKLGEAVEDGTIDSPGFIAIINQGINITGSSTDDGHGGVTCNMQIGASNIRVTGVSVAPTTINPLAIAAQAVVVATVTPSNASNRNIIWSSSNTSHVTVNSNGVVTGVATGSAVITATTADGLFTATCTVTVP